MIADINVCFLAIKFYKFDVVVLFGFSFSPHSHQICIDLDILPNLTKWFCVKRLFSFIWKSPGIVLGYQICGERLYQVNRNDSMAKNTLWVSLVRKKLRGAGKSGSKILKMVLCSKIQYRYRRLGTTYRSQ